MEPFTGLVMFHLALGALGIYFMAVTIWRSEEKINSRWHQYGLIAVIVAFMLSGLYFYNIPPIG